MTLRCIADCVAFCGSFSPVSTFFSPTLALVAQVAQVAKVAKVAKVALVAVDDIQGRRFLVLLLCGYYQR